MHAHVRRNNIHLSAAFRNGMLQNVKSQATDYINRGLMYFRRESFQVGFDSLGGGHKQCSDFDIKHASADFAFTWIVHVRYDYTRVCII